MSKPVKLPSGAELQITVSPFATSRALYQAVLEEGKDLKINLKEDAENFMKDLFCTLLSSKKIEACLEECFKRVTYNKRKIDQDTFEPVEAREDYFTVCFEVARENLLPFTKNLYAQYEVVLGQLQKEKARA